ncbi:hypothetical protein EVAR_73119_1 [Eumeta japonica]|uniref:Uncharacterized protein n=1 Tax=Eumeta variegata TaxID=151549 RepID=A0A4C1T2J4_EUMVA|nr:hypothetical protein EVAR_73119_1 [Eumeta japonica]
MASLTPSSGQSGSRALTWTRYETNILWVALQSGGSGPALEWPNRKYGTGCRPSFDNSRFNDVFIPSHQYYMVFIKLNEAERRASIIEQNGARRQRVTHAS